MNLSIFFVHAQRDIVMITIYKLNQVEYEENFDTSIFEVELEWNMIDFNISKFLWNDLINWFVKLIDSNYKKKYYFLDEKYFC